MSSRYRSNNRSRSRSPRDRKRRDDNDLRPDVRKSNRGDGRYDELRDHSNRSKYDEDRYHRQRREDRIDKDHQRSDRSDRRSSRYDQEDDDRDRKRTRRDHTPDIVKERNGKNGKGRRSYGDEKRHDRPKGRKDEYESEEDFVDIKKMGIREISEDDYFLKSGEFKHWLRDVKSKYLDEMSGESARKYFRRFVRRWNDGALSLDYYRPPSVSSSSNTAYKWSFSGSARRDQSASPIDRQSYPRREGSPDNAVSPNERTGNIVDEESSGEDIGPTLPPSLLPSQPKISHSDAQLRREEEYEMRKREKRKDRKEAFERVDELVPKSIGKEGKMAEKKASNAMNKEMREKDVGGLEVDEGVLMGEEGSFQSALRARDGALGRRAEKRAEEIANRRAAMDDRMAERRQKEAATMDMLKAMAKQRFG